MNMTYLPEDNANIPDLCQPCGETILQSIQTAAIEYLIREGYLSPETLNVFKNAEITDER